jgi:uncharacterized membrane protein
MSLLSLLNNSHASTDAIKEGFIQEWMSKMVCPPNIEVPEVQVDIYTDAQFELDRLELEEYSRENPRCDEAIARYNKAFLKLEELYLDIEDDVKFFDVEKCNQLNKEFPVSHYYYADEDNEDEDIEEFDAEKCNQLNKEFPVSHYYYADEDDEEEADEEFDAEKCNQLNKEFPVPFTGHAYYYAVEDNEDEEDIEEFDVEKCNQLNKEFPVPFK